MSKSIWKYELMVIQSPQSLEIQAGAIFLHCELFKDQIALWFEVDPMASWIRRNFLVVGTGWDLPPNRIYRGTINMDPMIWHIYEQDLSGA